MKKFFNLLVMVAMCLAVSTNVCAQTKRTQTRKTTTTTKRSTTTTPKTTTIKKTTTPAAKPKPQMVDMGLSVKWSNIDLGAATTKSAGGLYYASEDLTKSCGEDWRLPTLEEFNELIDNCDKMILENNGVPSCIELTSKRNGAKIYLYIPKVSLKNSEKNVNAVNPTQGIYTIYLNLSNNKIGFFGIISVKSYDEVGYKKMKYAINKAGLSRVKYTEWPNEILNQFDFIRKSQKDAFFSYYMDWFGTLGNMDGSNNIVATTRPVYSADDDDEEEE